jgi:hypothetical protein
MFLATHHNYSGFNNRHGSNYVISCTQYIYIFWHCWFLLWLKPFFYEVFNFLWAFNWRKQKRRKKQKVSNFMSRRMNFRNEGDVVIILWCSSRWEDGSCERCEKKRNCGDIGLQPKKHINTICALSITSIYVGVFLISNWFAKGNLLWIF